MDYQQIIELRVVNEDKNMFHGLVCSAVSLHRINLRFYLYNAEINKGGNGFF